MGNIDYFQVEERRLVQGIASSAVEDRLREGTIRGLYAPLGSNFNNAGEKQEASSESI